MRLLFLGSYHRMAERNRILIRGLREHGVEVIERNFPMPSLRFRGVGVRVLAQLARGILSAPAYAARMAAGSLDAAKADAVLMGYLGHHDLLTGRALRLCIPGFGPKPLVFDPFFSVYDTVVSDRRLLQPGSLGARLLRRSERYLLRIPHLVLADTTAHAAYYSGLAGLPYQRVRVVPVGVETEVFAPSDPPPLGDEFRVLFYGTYIPLHGVEVILVAASLLRDEGLQFRLIGRGQTRPMADGLARRLQLANVTFVDWVPFHELVNEIAAAHIVLGIFGTSGKAARVVPNKVYQAMSVGRCVVTRDSPAIREMFVPGEHLAVCPPGDPHALAETIRQLRADPARLAALAAAGRAVVRERFSVQAIGAAAVAALEYAICRYSRA
jgi:glycosyltransferase involved in cell wall biosynthesis